MFGEVGLAGEIRSVDRVALRLKEAKSLGFTRCLVAKGNVAKSDVPKGLSIEPVADVAEAVAHLFGEAALRSADPPPSMTSRVKPPKQRYPAPPPTWAPPEDGDDPWGPRPVED